MSEMQYEFEINYTCAPQKKSGLGRGTFCAREELGQKFSIRKNLENLSVNLRGAPIRKSSAFFRKHFLNEVQKAFVRGSPVR